MLLASQACSATWGRSADRPPRQTRDGLAMTPKTSSARRPASTVTVDVSHLPRRDPGPEAALRRGAGHLPHGDRCIGRCGPAGRGLGREGRHIHQCRPNGASVREGDRAARPGTVRPRHFPRAEGLGNKTSPQGCSFHRAPFRLTSPTSTPNWDSPPACSWPKKQSSAGSPPTSALQRRSSSAETLFNTDAFVVFICLPPVELSHHSRLGARATLSSSSRSRSYSVSSAVRCSSSAMYRRRSLVSSTTPRPLA